MFEFINIYKHPVYFRLRDINISEGYKTDSQEEVGELCKIEGLFLVGSKEYAKASPEPKTETKKDKRK